MQELVSNLFQPQPEGDTAKVGGAAAADGGEAAGGAADSSVGVSVAPAGSKATCADAAVAAMAAAALSAVTPSVPDALRGKTQKVSCNDCGKESDAKFHFVYHACAHCRSYNTSVLTY